MEALRELEIEEKTMGMDWKRWEVVVAFMCIGGEEKSAALEKKIFIFLILLLLFFFLFFFFFLILEDYINWNLSFFFFIKWLYKWIELLSYNG